MKTASMVILNVIIFASTLSAIPWTNDTGNQNFNDPLNWFDLPPGYEFTSSDNAEVNKDGTDAAILSSDATRGILGIGIGNATGEVLVTGGTNNFSNGRIGWHADAQGFLEISGGDTTLSGYCTVGYDGGDGHVTINDGILKVNRSNMPQSENSVAELVINGGEFTVEGYYNLGFKGQGTIDMTGGTINLGEKFRTGRGSVDSVATLTISGDAEFNALEGYTTIGEEGYAAIYVNGGTLNLDRVAFATVDDPNSQGYLYVTDGTVNLNEYFTIGNRGNAEVEISGGVINTNRMLLGQGAIGESYTATGTFTISGGELNIEDNLEIGENGVGVFRIDGGGKVGLAQLTVGNSGTSEFILNGSLGVGKGIGVFGNIYMDALEEVVSEGELLLKEGAEIDAYFASGTDVAGDYVVVASSERAKYLPASEPDEDYAVNLAAGDMADFLAADAVSAGWIATLYDAGSGSAVVLGSPVSATELEWSIAGTDDIALIDDDSATLSTSKTANGAVIGDTLSGTLDVSSSADGQFVNLTVGRDVNSTGTVTMTGGSVDVESLAYIGKEGSASVDISGGSFSAFNLIAAAGEDADADITVSNDATFAVNNLLGLTDGSKLTVSGYQTSVSAGNLTLDEDANITFELDENHGVGNGLVVSGNVILKGTISAKPLGSRVEQTYTVLRAEGEIFDETDDLVDSPFVSYEIVENGNYQELQVTFFTPENCEDVIDGGFALAGDANNDCYVNMEDLAIMADEWVTCNDPENPECDLEF